jgi:Ni/Fe-hydrogenase 1 B-type cytochrome subunit
MSSPSANTVRLYVWEWPVRAAHWVIACSIALLSITGFYIGHPFISVPGEARMHFMMGTMRTIHLYAGIAFALAVVARVIWMFLGNEWARWTQLVPVSKARIVGIWHTFLWYLFLPAKPPPSPGHNPLAGAAYVGVYGLCFVQIVTGFGLYALYAGANSVFHPFVWFVPILGAQMFHWVHHVVMWLLLGFFVHHFYSSYYFSWHEKNGTIDSILTGFKFVPPDQAAAAHAKGGRS